MSTFVVSAPYYEIVTYLWCPYYRIWWKRELESYGTGYTLLFADEAQKSFVAEAMSKPDSKVLIGAGHGARCIFTGQYSRNIYVCGETFEELKGKCFAPVSCHVGEALLPDMISKGVACGIGERDPYYFVVSDENPKKGEDPRREDPLMACFIEAEAFYSRWLAAGRTAREAYDAMQLAYALMAEYVTYALKDYETAYYIRLDARNRLFFGDGEWRMRPKEEVVDTTIGIEAEGERDLDTKVDRVTVTVQITAANNTKPTGRADVLIVTQEQDYGRLETVEVKDGTFTVTFEIPLRVLTDTVYRIAVIYYGGKQDEYIYTPQIAGKAIVVKQKAKKTTVTIEKAECERKDETVMISRADFTVTGTVTDEDGKPVPSGTVEAVLEGGVKVSGTTDENGRFTVKGFFYPEPLETKRSGSIVFRGDWIRYAGSSADFTLKYPPNIKFILFTAGAFAALVLLILLLLTFV
ncbi:MAG: carboxypeptidase-like regulatory domain-containing protein [Thermofilaceae archaeon]